VFLYDRIAVLLLNRGTATPHNSSPSFGLAKEDDLLGIDRNIEGRSQGRNIRALRRFFSIDELNGDPFQGLELPCQQVFQEAEGLGQARITLRDEKRKVLPVSFRNHF
jgi:hypothetical protein